MQRDIRVLILVVDAGYGHRSAAQAIEAALIQTYGSRTRVTIANPAHHPQAPGIWRRLERGYLNMLQNTPQQYGHLHEVSENALVTGAMNLTVLSSLRDALYALVAEHMPDVIISTYPIFTTGIASFYKSIPNRPALIKVVTDLDAVHRIWFAPVDDVCTVPTQEVYDKALECGMRPEQVLLSGIPVHPRFTHPRADKHTLRRDLGWHEDMTTLLLVGGGGGVGAIDALAQAIDIANLPLQLAVIAGRNKELAATLRAHTWTVPTRIYDFVPLPDLIHAADIVATKPGALSISEALVAGKPLLLHGAAPGQEAGNTHYVEKFGAGVHIPDPETMVAKLHEWTTHPEVLEQVTHAARALGKPDAAFQVARLAGELVAARPRVTPLVLRPSLSERLASWL